MSKAHALSLLVHMLLAALGGLAPAVASASEEEVRKFSFGPPDSVTRAGFTKVTAADAFLPEKGYGFRSIEGLQAIDRGGSKIESPVDAYTASVYGAYRTTSDITCAFIEGTADNAFTVALPDGAYTVWAIAGDAEEDPPLYEIWADGEKKLDVRIPRRAFVFMEPFRGRATDGALRIELKGPHGWLLDGLVIGKEGPALDEVVARLDRDIFFLTDEELPRWKEDRYAPVHPPLEWTAEERERGYVVFPVDPMERVVPAYVPSRASVGKPLTAFASPGEFEPATFCILAAREVGSVSVELADFIGEEKGRTIPRPAVDLGIVRCRPVRARDTGGKGTYEVVPQMIEPPAGRVPRVSPGAVKQWWLTAHVPQDAAAGRYRMAVTVRPERARPTAIEWRLIVLPFRLTTPAGKHWGTWLESFPPVGSLRGPERRGRNTRAELDRLARADLEDFREHGFDLAIFNYYFGVKESPDGTFTYDLSGLARDLEYWRAVNSRTPVVIGMEYTCRNLEYGLAEPGKKHVPGTFSPRAHQAIVGLVRRIRDEALRRGWPELYFYPIDEPGNSKTENRMRFAESVLDFVHEVPSARTATTVGSRDIQRLGDRVDVRIYAYGSYNRNKVLQDARQGHPFWFYENGMFYGHGTIASRGLAGFEFLRSGAEVATAWGFDATQANPHNDFDGGHRDWNVVFPGVDRLTPTIYWELCREGVDDCRYAATLGEEIRRARERGQAEAARRAEEVLAPIVDPDARPIEEPRSFGRYRWRIAREILNLLGDRRLALPFAAVTGDKVVADEVGPNLIPDPSFEEGPQADGFPTGGYSIAERYSKPEARPVGALAVTDEVAHSGRYSLKWDFSKAEGKGSIYGRDRWLIVNVQVPPAAAKSLRGRRVKVGYWFRLGGGAAVPGMVLRQSGRGEYLDGLAYGGGIEDPTVWNRFEAEGRLRDDYESMDIHISCPIPSDPDLARNALFYIDDVTLAAIEEPLLTLSIPLDEYYAGEPIPWSVRAASPEERIRVALSAGGRVVAEETRRASSGMVQGAFETRGLEPGVYSLRADAGEARAAGKPAQKGVIVSPDPFAW